MARSQEELRLIEAVRAEEGDDAALERYEGKSVGRPALAYAEWLEKRDGPGDRERAEYVRLEVQLARGEDLEGRPLGGPTVAIMRRAADCLYDTRVREADELLRRLGLYELGHGAGLPRYVSMNIDNFLANGDLLSEAAPTVTHLRLRGGGITPAKAEALAASPALAQLTRLSLENSGLRDEQVMAVAKSPHLRGLKQLRLGGNRVTDEGAKALADSTGLPGLELLGLHDNRVTDEGAEALTTSPGRDKLLNLNLQGNRVSPHTMALIERELGDRRKQAGARPSAGPGLVTGR